MSEAELETNLGELYQYDVSLQSWLERKWLPHKHVNMNYFILY